MNNLELFFLKDIADSQTGPFGSQLHQSDYVSKGTPMVTVEHLGVERFTHQNLPFVSDKDRDRLSKYILREGDIVFSRVGSVDRCTYVTKEEDGWMFSGRCIRVRTNKSANGRYLNFYFRQDSFKKMMLDISVGATMPSLNTKLMDNIPLRLPNIIIQKKIAKILSDLDAKIELNNKINTELEAMAKTLYDYWFVQFDFPDANGKPYKTSGGKMVWNDELKREIPEGWNYGELKDIANITMGQSPEGESYNEEGKGSVFYQGCTDFGNRFPTIRKFTTSPTRFARPGDILLSVRAPVGTLNISKEDCCIGRGLACMNSKNDAITYLFGVMVNLKQIFDRRNVSGTTFGSITKDDLFSLPVLIPHEKTVRAFHNIVFPTFEKQNKIEFENLELASLRDWLLPMLMNGQVTIGDVQEELAMVAEPAQIYKKTDKKIIEKVKKAKTTAIKLNPVDVYKRTLLAAEIVFQLKDTYTLGHLKLQKMLFLCQELENMALPMNFLKQAMGPYDNQLARSLDKQFVTKKWFIYQKAEALKFKPLENCGKHQDDFNKYFEDQLEGINYLIKKFTKFTSTQIEAVATLYACWKEAIENNELINDKLIITKFYNWSKEKEKFKEENLVKALAWMRKNGIEPKTKLNE